MLWVSFDFTYKKIDTNKRTNKPTSETETLTQETRCAERIETLQSTTTCTRLSLFWQTLIRRAQKRILKKIVFISRAVSSMLFWSTK